MKIKFLNRSQVDDLQWDACIYKSFNTLVYANTWYLDEVCDQWDALVLDDYRAVMPLPRRSKWGITYTYQPFFCQQLGVFSTVELSSELVNNFFRAIPGQYSFIDIQTNIFTKPVLPGIAVKEKINHRLPLIAMYEKLVGGYNDNTRRNLKKAAAAALQAHESIVAGNIISLYRSNYAEKTPEIGDLDYLRLYKLVESAAKMGCLHTCGVADADNNLCAGAIFLMDHKNAYYLLGGANETGRENGAMHLLFDDFIRRNATRDLVLDFEGSEIEGIARFYKGFGAKPVHYYSVKQNRLPWWMRWMKR